MSGVRIGAGARAVVTGAGSGIGEATALRCAAAGARVVCVDIDGEAARVVAGACGSSATAFECDVADAEAVLDLARVVEDEHGPVDVLVNNAGVGLAGPFLDASLDDWRWLRSINLDGVVHGCHAFGPGMVARRRGQVVNVASGAGYIASRDMAAYCASKAAVVMLSRCLRADWARHDVGVSAICPGLIRTPIASRSRLVGPLAGRQEAAAKLFRFGHPPATVAKAICAAAERDTEVVPVGLESVLAYRLLRHAPGPVQGLLARAEVLR